MNIANSSRIYITCFGANTNSCGAIVLFTNNGGTVYSNKIGASNITVSSSQANKVTFTDSGANNEMFAAIFAGNISE